MNLPNKEIIGHEIAKAQKLSGHENVEVYSSKVFKVTATAV
jgi:hypothetical protein